MAMMSRRATAETQGEVQGISAMAMGLGQLAASALGFRPVPEQDPEHATLLLGTPHFGESGKNHRPFFRKGFADTRYCPM